jgi:hypothetical protein
MVQLVKVWLAYQGVSRPKMRLAPETRLKVSYPPLMGQDERLTLEKYRTAIQEGAISRPHLLRGLALPTVADETDANNAVLEADEERDSQPNMANELAIDRLATQEAQPMQSNMENSPDGRNDGNQTA